MAGINGISGFPSGVNPTVGVGKAAASGGAADSEELSPEVIQPKDTPVSAGGNDVSMDMEMGELLKNSSRYKTLMRVMSKMYQQMAQAMQGE